MRPFDINKIYIYISFERSCYTVGAKRGGFSALQSQAHLSILRKKYTN